MLKKLVPYISAIFVDLGALMSGPLSVIFGLLAAFNVIGQRKLFAALMVAALIVLVLRQAKKILELREKLRPKFQVACDTSIDGCRVLSYLNTVNGTPMGSSFYRVKVSVNGAEEIKECTGYITLIYKDSLVRSISAFGTETISLRASRKRVASVCLVMILYFEFSGSGMPNILKILLRGASYSSSAS